MGDAVDDDQGPGGIGKCAGRGLAETAIAQEGLRLKRQRDAAIRPDASTGDGSATTVRTFLGVPADMYDRPIAGGPQEDYPGAT